MAQPADYVRADYELLRKTGYGVGVHWTNESFPRKGGPRPFEEAVNAFEVPKFVQQVRQSGAGHVLFTADHSRHRLACPNPEVDRIMAGMTCRRDLVMEIADALEEVGIRLMLYYNHGLCKDMDDWKEAVGANDPDKTRYFENWKRIIGWMGEHYGPKVIAWWIDGAKPYAAWGAPWKDMTATARAGFAARLVCYNNALEAVASLTPYQDYWAGEIARVNYVPRGPATPSGLPWYGFLDWHAHHSRMWAGVWGLWSQELHDASWPAPSTETLVDFYRRFEGCGGTVTFNLLIYQDGDIHDSDMAAMRKVKAAIRGAD